jgi:F420-0:gamma-glutamyl ligase-like protein
LGTDAALVSLAALSASKCFGVDFVVGELDVVTFVVGVLECELPQPAAIASSVKTAKALEILNIAHGTGASGARISSSGPVAGQERVLLQPLSLKVLAR